MSSSPNPPPSPPAPSLSQQEQQELQSLRREKASLSQLMWELVRMAAPETHDIEVATTPSDPLWQLVFGPSADEKSGRVRILAGAIKPMTEQDKKRVVRLLRGTDRQLIDVLIELRMVWPPSYVEAQIATHLKWSEETKQWASVASPSLGARVANLIGL